MVGHPDSFNIALFVEVHFINGHDSLVRSGCAERVAMIDDVPIVGSRNLQDGVMAGTAGDGGISLEYLPDAFERPGRAGAPGIGDSVA